jgi:hypothetical protein
MLAPQFHQPRLQRLDPLADQPAVSFKLRFTRAAQTNTALLPLKVSPGANQARGQVLELCKFDLQLAFMTAGTLRENVEDETGAVDHAPVQRRFQIALLRGREGVIKNDEFHVIGFAREAQLFDFAAADKHLGIGAGTATGQGDGGMGTRTLCEQTEFFETGIEIDFSEVDTDKRCVDQINVFILKRPVN